VFYRGLPKRRGQYRGRGPAEKETPIVLKRIRPKKTEMKRDTRIREGDKHGHARKARDNQVKRGKNLRGLLTKKGK